MHTVHCLLLLHCISIFCPLSYRDQPVNERDFKLSHQMQLMAQWCEQNSLPYMKCKHVFWSLQHFQCNPVPHSDLGVVVFSLIYSQHTLSAPHQSFVQLTKEPITPSCQCLCPKQGRGASVTPTVQGALLHHQKPLRHYHLSLSLLPSLLCPSRTSCQLPH